MPRNPVEETKLRRWSGGAVADAVPREVTKPLAEQLNLTPRQVRRHKDGENPSWLTDFTDKLDALHNAGGDLWPIVKHVEAYAKRLVIRGKSTAELVEREDALLDIEHERECDQNRALQNGERSRALRLHAATLTELDAVGFELDLRGADSRLRSGRVLAQKARER